MPSFSNGAGKWRCTLTQAFAVVDGVIWFVMKFYTSMVYHTLSRTETLEFDVGSGATVDPSERSEGWNLSGEQGLTNVEVKSYALGGQGMAKYTVRQFTGDEMSMGA